MGDSILDYIKLGVEYIFIAIFLLLFFRVVLLRNQYADAVLTERDAASQLQAHLEYATYNTGTDQSCLDECITADVIVSAIREDAYSSMEFYIVDKNGKITYNLNDDTRESDAGYTSLVTISSALDFSSYYHPYLLYDKEKFQKNPVRYSGSGGNVTGIAFYAYTGKTIEDADDTVYTPSVSQTLPDSGTDGTGTGESGGGMTSD
jgi:hypothetical protein